MIAVVSAQASLNVSTNYFVFGWYAASAPGTLVGSIQVLPKPYGPSFQATLTGLTSQVYIVKLWESVDATPTGTVRNSLNFLPSVSTTTVRMPEYLTTDVTPGLVSNTSTYINLTYAGWGYDVERKGQGTMFLQGAPNVVTPDYAQDISGGFHLVTSGDVFGPNEEFIVRFVPQIAPAAAASVGILTTGRIVTAATTFDNTYLNTAVFLQGASTSLPITLMPLSGVSDYQYVYLFSAGGSHFSAPITTSATDKFQRNGLITQIILCQNEILKIFKANGVWNIDYLSPTVDMVGEIIYKYKKTDFNYVFADGTAVSRTKYARLWAHYNGGADGGIAEASWSASTVIDGITYFQNKGMWTPGDGSTTFRLPLLYSTGSAGVGFLRAVDGISGRLAGSLQPDAQQDHQHDSEIGTFVGNLNGRGPTKVIPGYGAAAGSRQSDLSSHPGGIIGGTFTTFTKVDYETRSQNIGVYAVIRL